MQPEYERQEREVPIGFGGKLSQGVGAVPDTVKNWVFSTFILLFYNQILGVDAFSVSVVLAIAIVFDAITDPVVASFSDNLRSRWGRRHPLMLVASLPLGVGIYAIFVPPAGLSEMQLLAWLLLFVIMVRGFMTLYFVPWAAIASELSDDYHDRTSIMSYRYACGWTIGVVMPVITYTFFMVGTEENPVGQLNPAGYPAMAFCSALLLSGGALATTLLTLKQVPYLRQHKQPRSFSLRGMIDELVGALKNRQFALVFTIMIMVSALSGTTANIGIYMTTFFWGLTSDDLRWFALSAVGAVLAFPLVAGIQRRWDKKRILLVCTYVSLFDGMTIVSLRFLDVLPQNGDPMLLVILVGAGVFAAGVAVVQGIISASVLADILDDHELRTGLRQEGMFNAAISFSGKAVSSIGIVLGGLIITAIQFPTNLPPGEVPVETVLRLGLVVGIMIPLLYLIPISLIHRYRITREVHADIQRQLEARRRKIIAGSVMD
ncbi:MAG: MFS transporter [Pseudomonadales bacterium]|nr:MFS transporter [Pseudomonadales bacterium]MBO6597268.1 MFS transporter [Pseudomonadales bacterium]MBO6656895.1 MFS transporter [Pseudomonadales bacterium]MBO6703897.1 MFS transporter [Pseudomonadales bacterium]MBO6823546.1 MFS transporter [Pseudomonadales bacterium]